MLTSRKKSKILLVDDEPTNIQVLHGILDEGGYDFIFATDGASALEQAAQQAPDIILLDVMMPGMDGYEVCRRLKRDSLTQGIPVIFVTALKQMEDEEKGLEIGAIDYVTKPLSPAIVRVRVKNHLNLKMARDRLENMAMFDGLTGIANRRRFDDYLAIEWKRAGRNKTPLSIFLMDIDFFKPFNDSYGHAAGDECLKKVAASLAAQLDRPADLLARYGGEEFVCVLPETEGGGALKVAEQFLEAVRAIKVPHEFSAAADVVTMSMGCLTVMGGADLAPAGIIERVDKLLYQSKESGRNKVTAETLDA